MRSRTALVLLVALALSGCNVTIGDLPSSFGTVGSGVEMEEVREVAPFSEVDVSSAFDAKIEVGDDQHVLVRSDDNLVPLIETDVNNGRLSVSLEDGTNIVNSKSGLEVEIVVPSLVWLGASGASHVEAQGIKAEKFTLDVSGASQATLSGSTDDLAIEASGASQVRGKDLESLSAVVKASGASQVEVNAVEMLDASASGASQVCYVEGPVVTQDTSGASTIVSCD